MAPSEKPNLVACPVPQLRTTQPTLVRKSPPQHQRRLRTFTPADAAVQEIGAGGKSARLIADRGYSVACAENKRNLGDGIEGGLQLEPWSDCR